ncbi:Phosphoenolpyruvate synthase OS=Streptomyces tendae OX=1932 GN=GUR47_28005 PE=4 SV=1 [Streptomyces tendae]
MYSLDPAEATAIDDPSMLRSVVAGRRDGGELPGTRAPLPGSGPAPAIRSAGSDADRWGDDRLRSVRAGRRRWSGVERDEALHQLHRWAAPFVRAGYLELGGRLVRAGLLDADDDVFYLTGGELNSWVSTGAGDARWRDLVCERRLRRQWQRRLNPPDVVPTDARIMLFGTDITSRAFGGAPGGAGGRPERICGEPGSYTGRARVVHEIAEADALEREKILVVRQVTPAWAPLLARVGAVVADVGGALSHGSAGGMRYRIRGDGRQDRDVADRHGERADRRRRLRHRPAARGA